jgi:hypothetical protein
MTDAMPPAKTAKAKRERSPSFPFIPLSGAIKRLNEFEEYFKRHPAPAKHSGKAWGMKGWTSQAQQTLAALKSFGLLDYKGSGDNLEASVSEDGRTYLRAQQDSVKQEVLKRVALHPKNISKYFALWGADRPPDEVCLDQLVLKGGFTESAAKLFLQVYDSTIAFAKLADSDKSSLQPGDDEDDVDDPPPPAEVEEGDLVQREADGVLSFPKALRVRKVVEDQGHKWVFVDGIESAFLMTEAIVEAKGQTAPTGALTAPRLAIDDSPPEWREERLLDETGEEIFVRYKGEPSKERYEFIRDYLDFKLKRMK